MSVMIKRVLKGKKRSSIGMELELAVFDRYGSLSNSAHKLISDPRNDGSFAPESSTARVEVISRPTNSVQELFDDVLPRLHLLEQISADFGVMCAPVSEFCAGESKQRHTPRLDIYPHVIGKHQEHLIRTLAGLHLHFSQIKDRELEQYWIYTALDPISFAITSTSPISYRGRTRVNCHRMRIMRHRIPEHSLLGANLRTYPRSLDHLNERLYRRFDRWHKLSGLKRASFTEYFQPGNTGFDPIRKRERYNTFEVRGFDTCTLEYSMAAAALFKGCTDHFLNEEIPVVIAKKDNSYCFSDKLILLPNFKTLRMLQNEAIRHGMRSNRISNFLSNIINFAEKGLPVEDKPYLTPIRELLVTRTNISDRVLQHLRPQRRNSWRVTPREAARANLFLRGLYSRGIYSFSTDTDDSDEIAA